jgi:hypothetical protein
MTAINSLTHVKSMHTNVKVSSKHIRNKYVDFVLKFVFSIRPMRTSNYRLFVLI